jgi:hypothetical protein
VVPADDVLFEGRFFSVRAIRQGSRLPAKDWVDGLERADLAKFMAKVTRVDRYLESGVPTVETFGVVGASTVGLVEFRITPKKGKAPHLRMLGLLYRVGRGVTYWAALGFKKQKNQLTKREIEVAEAMAARWKGEAR